MKYETAGAFRTALEQRLMAQSRELSVPLLRLRKLVVFDRLIARLVTVAPDRWILKGAVALHYRVGPRYRTTKDIDLGRQDSEEAATADFLAAQLVDLADYFTFAIERTRHLELALEGVASGTTLRRSWPDAYSRTSTLTWGSGTHSALILKYCVARIC